MRRQQLFRIFLCFFISAFSVTSWAYTFAQSSLSLQRFLEDNPSQLPLIEQLSVRVHSQPIRLMTVYPETQKIAVVLRTSPSQPENQAWLFAFKRRMQELNIDFRMDVFYMPRGEGTTVAVNKYTSIQETDFDYVIIDKVDDHNRPLIENLLRQAQQKVIVLNSFAPYPAWRLHPPLLYIGTDLTFMMNRLASLIDRALDTDAIIDSISSSEEGILANHCQMFLNELSVLGRPIRYRYRVNDEDDVSRIVNRLINKIPDDTAEHFVFSCTPSISEEVVSALISMPSTLTKTNAWLGQSRLEFAHQKGVVLVTVLEMKDKMAIATAEAIKADIELRLLPRVYAETVTFLTQDMDQETRLLTFQQALQYSFSLWPR